MASFAEAFAVLDDFRLAVMEARQNENRVEEMTVFLARGGLSAFLTPMTNIHATGVGIRLRGGNIVENDFVLKVYVFDKQDLGIRVPNLMRNPFQGVGIDVEHMPIQQALIHKGPIVSPGAITPAQHQQRQRPVLGGIQISPLHANFVGTLGCFVKRGSNLFALSNNHVLAATNHLALGTPIVQSFGSLKSDVFSMLNDFEPIRFPGIHGSSPRNSMDAAIAAITDANLVATGKILGIANYTPQLLAPLPSMRVIKSGRTTGVTRGMITAIRVNGVGVNYGTLQSPMIATFDNCLRIVGANGQSFSLPGDSGSAILEEASGRPVALLFAGDTLSTTACNLTSVCSRFNVVPA